MAENIKRHITHIKSKVVESNSPKLPTASQIEYGELAINYAKGYETISIKNESGDVVTFNTNTFYGTCTTAAATKDKVVTLSNASGWRLKSGVIVGVKFSNSNSFSGGTNGYPTLNVNSSGAKYIWYNTTSANTGTNTTAYGYADRISYYMYDGTGWVWINQSVDNNTTYSTMSAAELSAGTKTTQRVMTAANLKTGGDAIWAAKSHNQASSTITSMTSYSKPSSTSAIATGDTLNQAIGKLEKALDGKQASGSYLTGVTLASGTNNGTLKLTVNGSATDNIAVKGLGTAAYKAEGYFAGSGHSHSTYVKYSDTEQTIESTIATMSKGVIELYRKANGYTFISFANNNANGTKQKLGYLGFCDSDINVPYFLNADGGSRYKLWHEGYCQGTLTGKLTAIANHFGYMNDGTDCGLDMANSDIAGVNSIFMNDTCDNWTEAIHFKRTNGAWDSLRALDGTLYFTVNSGATEYKLLHTGNAAYLPLSGGTMTGNVDISFNNTNDARIGVGNTKSDSTYIYLLASTNRGVYHSTKGWLISTDNTNTFLNIGNIGIGTNTPTYKLHVVGDAYVSGTFNCPLISSGDGNGLLAYKPASWSYVSNTQWGLGAVNCQGVIRSTDSDLIHSRGGTAYNILDSSNSSVSLNGSTLTVKINGVTKSLTAGGGGGGGGGAYLPLSGGTMSGSFTTVTGAYNYITDATSYGINMGNSDLVGVNSIYTQDTSDDWKEAIHFKRSNGNWDNFRACDGVFYFTINNGNSGARICAGRNNALYLGNSDNTSWLMAQDMCSAAGSGETSWSIRTDGRMFAKTHLNVGYNLTHQTANRAEISVISVTDVPSDLYLGANSEKKWALSCRASDQSYGFGIYSYMYGGFPLWVSNAGNVGIGTISPSYKLHVSGNIYATGGVTAASDKRMKDIVGNTELTVKQIADAPSVRFLWKKDHSLGEQVGTIAQYWQDVLPQAVSDKGGELGMQYGVAALVSSIATARKVVDHEKEIKALKAKINVLEERISELEK